MLDCIFVRVVPPTEGAMMRRAVLVSAVTLGLAWSGLGPRAAAAQAMQAMMQGMAGMARGMQRGNNAEAESAPKGTITPTGRSEVVAGVTCQVYSYDGTSSSGKHETGEVCLAKGAGVMVGGQIPGQMPGIMGMQMRQSMQQRLKGWGPLGTLLSQGYGILKATNNEDGKPNGSLVVTALQRGAPPEASFQPPAGFKEKSMGDMMGGGRR